MQNNLKPCLMLCCLVAFTVAAAAESTVDSLGKIESETLLLKARQKQLDVQAQIVSKQSEIATKQAEVDRLTLTHTATLGDPMIRSIEGIGKIIYATLQLDNGNTMDVKTGDTLPNGMRILSIRQNDVVVETVGKRRIRLGTSTSTGTVAATPYNPAYSNMATALPPFVPTLPLKGAVR
jgi:type IV pilus biogenesis protein PilP